MVPASRSAAAGGERETRCKALGTKTPPSRWKPKRSQDSSRDASRHTTASLQHGSVHGEVNDNTTTMD